MYNPQSQGGWTYNLQSGSVPVQSGNTLKVVQGSSPNLQPTTNPMNVSTGGATNPGVTTSYDVGNTGPSAAEIAAAQKAAQDAARAAALRGEITNLVNAVKDIFNARYGQVDAAAQEQTGKLNDRFINESKDVTEQVNSENQKIGVAHAASGSFDSSYRGNNQDTVTKGGEKQIRDLGTELTDNLGKVGGWATAKKAGFDAEKGAMDTIASRLAESTDPNELTSIRNSIDAKIASLRSEAADNNTTGQNISALNAIAPTAQRAQKLQTVLSSVVAGNASPAAKNTIAERLVEAANVSPEDKQQLLQAFQSDLSKLQQPQA